MVFRVTMMHAYFLEIGLWIRSYESVFRVGPILNGRNDLFVQTICDVIKTIFHCIEMVHVIIK
jgi:hypothetical protein